MDCLLFASAREGSCGCLACVNVCSWRPYPPPVISREYSIGIDEAAWKYKNILHRYLFFCGAPTNSLVVWDVEHLMDMGHVSSFSCWLAKSWNSCVMHVYSVVRVGMALAPVRDWNAKMRPILESISHCWKEDNPPWRGRGSRSATTEAIGEVKTLSSGFCQFASIFTNVTSPICLECLKVITLRENWLGIYLRFFLFMRRLFSNKFCK
jgi:hypothetical protein